MLVFLCVGGYLYLEFNLVALGQSTPKAVLKTAAYGVPGYMTPDKISQHSKTATHFRLQPRFMLVWISLSVENFELYLFVSSHFNFGPLYLITAD